MTSRLSIIVTALAALAISPRAQSQSLLDLGNGNFLRGSPITIDPTTLVWKHKLSGAELRFPIAAVHRIAFSSQFPPNPPGDILLLDNGDVLSGSFESLDKDKAVIRSSFATAFTIPRARLRTARLSPGTSTEIYADAGDLAGWKANSPTGRPIRWIANNGVLEFNAKGAESIARTIKMPESVDVSFETAWNPRTSRFGMNGAALSMLLCADHDRPGEPMASGYSLNFNRSWLTVQRVAGNSEKDATLGRVQMSKYLEGGNSIRVRVVLNRRDRRVHVFLNGREAGNFQDDVKVPPTGSAIHFVGGGDTPIRIRNLRVESWNGLLGSKLASTTKSGQKSDLVLGTDGDELFGSVLAIRRDPKQGRIVDVVLSVNPSNPLSVPVHSIGHISFAQGEESAVSPEEAIIRLDDGARLTGKIKSFDGENLLISYLGDNAISLPANQLLSIEFPAALAHPVKPANDDGENNGSDFMEE